MNEYESKLASQRAHIVQFIKKCSEESELDEKLPRRRINEKNWDYFHGNVNWSYKNEDDPVIHLHKVGVAAERIRSKFKSAMMNYDRWLSVSREYDNPDAILTPFAARSLLFKQFKLAKAEIKISDAILNGALESRMVLKVSGKYVTKPRYVKKDGALVKEEKQIWQLDLPVLSFEQFKPDTKNATSPVYEIEEFRTEYFRLLANSSENSSDPDKPLRLEAVKKLQAFPERYQDLSTKHAEGNLLKIDRFKERKLILLQNFIGTILAEDGSVFEWENEDGSKMPLENIICVIANESEVVLDPKRNARWSSKSPYIYLDPLRSPGTGRKAILDAGTDINHAENELFSLMLAGALKSVHNVTYSRPSWIANKEVLSGGIKDGTNLEVSDSAPANAIPFGTVQTGKLPQESLVMKGMLDSVFAENVISNRLDLTGDMGDKNALATQMVQAKSAISDVFDSFSMDMENEFIAPLAEECLLEIVQHIDDMDENEVKACFGPDQDKASQFISLSPKERCAQVLGAFRFQGRGLKGIIANMQHAQALINLLNSMAANPIMQQSIESQVSAAKMFLYIVDLMSIDIEKIQPDQQERQMIDQKQLIRENAVAQAQAMQQAGTQQGQQQPGSQSQAAQPGSGVQAGNGQGSF